MYGLNQADAVAETPLDRRHPESAPEGKTTMEVDAPFDSEGFKKD